MKKLFKIIYTIIPFKKQIFLFLKKVWSPPESVYQHLHFTGIIAVSLGGNKKFKMKHYGFQIENEIFWKGLEGGWEKQSIGLWIKLCANADVIFDIGSNTGVYALIAECINPKAEVYAMEPVARVYKKLIENNQLNNYKIKCFELAASNYTGKATIYDADTPHIYSVTVNKNLSPNRKMSAIEINTITLDTLIEKENINSIQLMKIDVETHEPELLEGFLVHLKKFKPTMLIEVLSDETGARIQKIIEEMGYLFFNIDENKGITRVQNITKSDYFNYLLCDQNTAKLLQLI